MSAGTTLVVVYMDGVEKRVQPQHAEVHDGVLYTWNDIYGRRVDRQSFPLVNVREWRWDS